MTTSTNWNEYVSSIERLGFTRVTIVNRATFDRIIDTYKHEQNNYEKTVNKGVIEMEDKQLLDSWGDKLTFYFYDKTFRIILRDQIEKKEIEKMNQFLTAGYVKSYSKNTKDVVVPNELNDIIYQYLSNMMYYDRCKYIAGLGINNDTAIIVAYQFKSVWFVVSGTRKKWRYRRHTTDGGFNDLRQAWTKVSTNVFDFLDKVGI